MHRRYNRWHMRFDQPDPSDGSYDLTDPQTFNRYTYTDNDPVNFTDPTGLQASMWYSAVDASLGWGHFSAGFWGDGDLMNRTRSLGRVGNRGGHLYVESAPGLQAITEGEYRLSFEKVDGVWRPLYSHFTRVLEGRSSWDGYGFGQQGRFVGSAGVPEKTASQRDQDDFNACARTAWRRYRRTYVGTSARAVIGGAGLGVGLSAFVGINGIGLGMRGAVHAAKDTGLNGVGRFLTSGVEMAHGSALSTAFSLISGNMAVNAVRDGERNSQRLAAALNDCLDRFPLADPSRSFLNF